jgi:DnaK suppressor protein
VKKPLKTSSKTAVKKTSTPAQVKTTAKGKPSAPEKKLSKLAPAKAVKTAVTKAVVKAKPVEKKAAPKAVSKPASKTATKPVNKPVGKAPAKPVAKAKPAAKPVAKSAPKPVAKAPVKVAARVAVKAAAKAPPKAAPKSAPKAAAKPAAKPSPQKPLKVTAKPVVPVKPEKAAKPAKAEKPVKPAKAEKAAPVTAPVVAPVASGDVPARAVRPSARLAQITVPSMAQSVASTAAKASYLQNMPTQALTPPPFVAVKKDAKLANNWKTKKPDQLSDAEIMAMSDKDYMNDAQMAYFRIKLVILKQGILANAGETTEHLREDTVVVPDPADRATIEEEHALELRTRDRERKLLKKIEQSIQRIDSGDYGYCDETGEPIGVGRLLARPTANLSLEAQQRRELKQKMFGD